MAIPYEMMYNWDINNIIPNGGNLMTQAQQQVIKIIENLDEVSTISVLNFARFLAAENDDIALYDKVKENDDGYRISSQDLRTKYGI